MAKSEHVSAVPIGRSVIGLEVEIIQQGRDSTRPVVERTAVSVRRREAQSLAVALGQRGLQRIVVAGQSRSALDRAGGATELGVQRLACLARSWRRRVDLAAIWQVASEIARIADRRDQTVPADVVL